MMITGSYTNLVIPREFMNPHWEKALEWLAGENLAGENWKDLPPGRVEIDSPGVYATLSAYQTKPLGEATYETHRRYADIQIILEGTELILACDPRSLTRAAPYDPGNDYELFTGDSSGSHRIILHNPGAVVFFPADAHCPGIAAEETPSPVRKLVVKVRLD
jgi:YhcH/YjgK/YiaL family protein